ncbi:hypothetical protein [Chondromyces crocatus]|uniref:Secreted protein n=1 Tax=Chondromyces crocatus TaxID=52 RepID=A0A0K1EHM9_CHOCO|nr:hypothetical protein [Chondromyces crocatus]AKT40182.1 uncharacterized protein CMC5_043350 [Chondromyces crocatus]
MRSRVQLVAWWLAAATLVHAAPSAAGEPGVDGAYGRLEGDLSLRGGIGAAFAQGGPSLSAHGAAVFLETAGVYVHYTDAVGQDAPVVTRSFAAGVHLQPLFLARYVSDLERGPARLDLFLDSLALGVGAFWDARRAAFTVPQDVARAAAGRPGLEVALSMSFPLFSEVSGPHVGIRGALRWRAVDLEGRGTGDLVDRGALLSLTFSWHQTVAVHLVDAGDRVDRSGRPGARVARSVQAAPRAVKEDPSPDPSPPRPPGAH